MRDSVRQIIRTTFIWKHPSSEHMRLKNVTVDPATRRRMSALDLALIDQSLERPNHHYELITPSDEN